MRTKKGRRSGRPTARAVRKVPGVVLVGAAGLLACAAWWRKNPSACPYGLRFFLELPHPFV